METVVGLKNKSNMKKQNPEQIILNGILQDLGEIILVW